MNAVVIKQPTVESTQENIRKLSERIIRQQTALREQRDTHVIRHTLKIIETLRDVVVDVAQRVSTVGVIADDCEALSLVDQGLRDTAKIAFRG